jgi:hypothetical protein
MFVYMKSIDDDNESYDEDVEDEAGIYWMRL